MLLHEAEIKARHRASFGTTNKTHARNVTRLEEASQVASKSSLPNTPECDPRDQPFKLEQRKTTLKT
jgi:hypothetical protein